MQIKSRATFAGLAAIAAVAATGAHASASPIAATSAAAAKVTLGSAQFAAENSHYLGAGEVKPRTIGDGNTCQGQASELRWKKWGSSRATATGKICDISNQTVKADAVAYDLGRCTANCPKVYRRAKVRIHGEQRWFTLNTFGAGGKLCKSKV
jgi:hypothetical protein